MSPQRKTTTAPLTEIMLSIFRLNALLLEKGDRLVAPLQLTSARWQALGAIALAGEPLTAPQIADAMGITRQGAQKQLRLAHEEGLVEIHANPRHERSPLYKLSKAGTKAYDNAMVLQAEWARSLAHGTPLADLKTALRLLNGLEARLKSTPLPTKGK